MLQSFFRFAGLPAFFAIAISFTTGSFAPAAAQQTRASAHPPSRTYILGTSDRVRVKVYGEPDITGEYEVDGSGSVSIPGRAWNCSSSTAAVATSTSHNRCGNGAL